MEKQTINEKWVFTTLLTLTILSGVFLSLPSASADVVDNISVIVPKSCSMSSTLSSAHSTDINNGHYLDNIGETVIKATCNDAEGFSIYAIGFTDDEYGKTVLTSSLGEAHNIVTGTAESGSISNWAMKLSPVDGAYAPSILSDSDGSYSNYHAVPETYTKVATRTSGTDLVVGASLKTTYSAYISGTQSAGTYEGKVKYTIVHPANAKAPAPPTTLEQAYEKKGKEKYNGYYKMQDMNAEICDMANLYDEDSEIQLIDVRDNKLYWTTKLKDNHCWMTQNLDLDLGVATLSHNETTLYHDDTDLGWGSDDTTLSWTPANPTIDATSGIISGFQNDYFAPYSVDPGDWYYTDQFLASTSVNYLENEPNDYFAKSPYPSNGLHGHVGNYYNWTATVASNSSSHYTDNTYNSINSNPQNSICPAGWRLPTITGSSPIYSEESSKDEFSRLVYLYNNNTLVTESSANLESSPLYLTRSGQVNSNLIGFAGDSGYLWSSTVYQGGYSSYSFHFSRSSVSLANYGSRYYGYPVRCLAR